MRRLTTAALLLALAAVPTARADWTTYGGASSRAGVAHGAPASPGLRRRFARTVDGQIYAQPLIAGGRIYVATENNSVYAFSASGKKLWRRHLGTPVDGGSLPCGNIDPSGITGTPVISHGRLFAVAFLGAGKRHVLYGLSLRRRGKVVVRRNVDPPNREVEQERAALTAVHGRIYVPYGGLAGDCGPFRAWIVSVTETGRRRISYRNPATEAGIWTPGGLSAQSGTLLAATGNGGPGPFGYQNSVIRLSLGLHRRGFWAPTNWRALSQSDADVNSLAPLPVSGGNVFQIGKTGVGWLLSHSLGGIGKELFSARVCGGAAFGADAFRAPLAIVPCGGSIYALRIDGNHFTRVWSAADGRVPVIAGNSVYAQTGGGLSQIRISDGRVVGHADVSGGDTSFPAPAVDGHTLVAPAGRGIVVFGI